MSDTQAYEEVTTVSDGVTVTKRYEADEFPVPAIAFTFESQRSDPVTVQISDEVPDDVAVEDLGFHPEYGSEYWTIDDETIRFERELEPDAEYTTVYGIRATGTDNVDQFLTQHDIEEVHPPLEDDEEPLVGEGSDAVRDVISGDADSVPGLDDVDDEDIDTLDLKDPNGQSRTENDDDDDDDVTPAESPPDGSSEDDEASDQETAAAAVDPEADSLVAAIATELRNQEASKEDVKLLRKAFDLADQDDGSVVARVQKLQRDVSDVIAYTEALEEFLDENGTGDQLIADFQDEVAEFRTEIETFESELSEVESDVEENESAVDSLSDDVDDVEESMDDVESTVSNLEARMDDLRDELDEVSDGDVVERVDEIDQEIEDLKEWREQLSSVIGGN